MKKKSLGKNQLLKTIEDVLDNRVRSDNLSQVLETSISRLERNVDQFNAWVASLSPDVKSDNYNLINKIDNLFKEYQNILEETASYIINRDISILESVPLKIKKITETLNKEMFIFSQIALKAMGPTEFPGVNQIIATVRRIKEGEQIAGELNKMVIREIAVIESTLEEMDIHHKGEYPPELRATFEEILECLDQFGEFFATEDISVLGPIVDNLISISKKFQRLGGSKNIRELAKKPTSSPIANIVINCARGVKEDIIDLEFFETYLNKLRDLYQEMKLQYNSILNMPPESVMAQEESVAFGKIMEAFEENLNHYYEILETKNFDRFDEEEKALISVIEDVEKSMNKFKQLSIQEGMVTCVKCGHRNPGVNRKCENCSGVLPVFNRGDSSQMSVFDGGGSQSIMTEKVHNLFVALESLENNRINSRDFEKVIADMEIDLNQAYRVIGAIPQVEGDEDTEEGRARELIRKASGIYQQGLDEFKTGLVMLRIFASTNSMDSKQTGSQMIWQGMEKLQQVQRLLEPIVQK
jgi:hypothetical protein